MIKLYSLNLPRQYIFYYIIHNNILLKCCYYAKQNMCIVKLFENILAVLTLALKKLLINECKCFVIQIIYINMYYKYINFFVNYIMNVNK